MAEFFHNAWSNSVRTHWWTSDELTNSYLVKTKWQIEAAKLGSLCRHVQKMWRAASWERAEIVCRLTCPRAAEPQLPSTVCSFWAVSSQAQSRCAPSAESSEGGLGCELSCHGCVRIHAGPRGALSVSPSVSHHVSLLYLRSAVLCGSSHTAGSLQELSGRPPAGRMVAVQAVLTAESKSTCTDFVPAL